MSLVMHCSWPQCFAQHLPFFKQSEKKLLSILIQFIAQVSKENVFDRLVGMNLSFKKKVELCMFLRLLMSIFVFQTLTVPSSELSKVG